MKLIPAVCPRCGANVELPDGLEKAHCVYCGTQILFGRASVGKGIRCPVCEGFGRVDRCRACDGTGRCAWSTVSSGSRQDIFAQGYSSRCDNGVCSACGGSGRWNLGGFRVAKARVGVRSAMGPGSVQRVTVSDCCRARPDPRNAWRATAQASSTQTSPLTRSQADAQYASALGQARMRSSVLTAATEENQ